jgi:hypothetical protein
MIVDAVVRPPEQQGAFRGELRCDEQGVSLIACCGGNIPLHGDLGHFERNLARLRIPVDPLQPDLLASRITHGGRGTPSQKETLTRPHPRRLALTDVLFKGT